MPRANFPVKQKHLTAKSPFHIIQAMIDSANNDNEILSRRIHFNLLYDFYSPLLTERQRKVYETLCFSDLTLSEAAEILGVSRQAVYILARNVMDKLEGIERDLHLAFSTRQLEDRIKVLEAENESLRRKLNEKETERPCLTH